MRAEERIKRLEEKVRKLEAERLWPRPYPWYPITITSPNIPSWQGTGTTSPTITYRSNSAADIYES